MISAHIRNKIYHLTLKALPHYSVKYEQAQFCKTRIVLSRNERFFFY